MKNVKKLVFFLLSTALTGCVTGDKSIEEVDSTASLQHHAHLPGEDHIFACPKTHSARTPNAGGSTRPATKKIGLGHGVRGGHLAHVLRSWHRG